MLVLRAENPRTRPPQGQEEPLAFIVETRMSQQIQHYWAGVPEDQAAVKAFAVVKSIRPKSARIQLSGSATHSNPFLTFLRCALFSRSCRAKSLAGRFFRQIPHHLYDGAAFCGVTPAASIARRWPLDFSCV